MEKSSPPLHRPGLVRLQSFLNVQRLRELSASSFIKRPKRLPS